MGIEIREREREIAPSNHPTYLGCLSTAVVAKKSSYMYISTDFVIITQLLIDEDPLTVESLSHLVDRKQVMWLHIEDPLSYIVYHLADFNIWQSSYQWIGKL